MISPTAARGGDGAGAPWLSVVMPAYRGDVWIDHALRSLAAQPLDGVEILLIDGGPTPATRKIAATYADRLCLKIIERPGLVTWQAKANLGIAAAASTHACLLCVDDVWLPGRASSVRRWIESAPGAALHLAPSILIDRHGRKLGRWRCPLPSGGEVRSSLVAERLLVQNFIASPAPVFRKDAWLQVGGLDEQLWYTADWDLWLKLAAIGPVHYHAEVTCGFRIHGGSLTASGARNSADLERQMVQVLDRHLPRVPSERARVERAARASIGVNAALALASAGDPRGLAHAAAAVLRLGPAGVLRFLRDSRILERLMPRLRARLRGAF
jgi:hypothetical protein